MPKRLTLQKATFTFTDKQGRVIVTECWPDFNPVSWKVITGGKVITVPEVRTHQFINQTRAKEIIEQALQLEKNG